METLYEFYAWFNWLKSIWSWFISPSVEPWAGFIAAILAAITIHTKGWISSCGNFVLRTLRVTIIWLAVILILSLMDFGSSGSGRDSGGSDGKDPVNTITAGPTQPINHPEGIDLTISFPIINNDTLDFACNVSAKRENGEIDTLQIREQNNSAFEKKLEKILINAKLQKTPKIIIWKNPFPGEFALKTVEGVALAVYPNCSVARRQSGEDKK